MGDFTMLEVGAQWKKIGICFCGRKVNAILLEIFTGVTLDARGKNA